MRSTDRAPSPPSTCGIDYQKPATPGLDIKAHSICYPHDALHRLRARNRLPGIRGRSVATATACFTAGANDQHAARQTEGFYRAPPPLEAPKTRRALASPFARRLGIRIGEDGVPVMPFARTSSVTPILRRSRRHDGRVSRNGGDLRRRANSAFRRRRNHRPLRQLPVVRARAGHVYAKVSIVKQGRRVVAFEAQAWQGRPGAADRIRLWHVEAGSGRALKTDMAAITRIRSPFDGPPPDEPCRGRKPSPKAEDPPYRARLFSRTRRAKIEAAIAAAASAPSGANQHLDLRRDDPDVQKAHPRCRRSRKKAFYDGRAGKEWLGGAQRSGHGTGKSRFSKRPWLIAIFQQRWGVGPKGERISIITRRNRSASRPASYCRPS